MAINRYSTPAIAQFNPLSYEEIMAIPMAQYKEYGNMLEEWNKYDTATQALPSAQEYLQHGQMQFEQELTAARESLEKYGAFASKAQQLALRKKYQDFQQNYKMPVEQHFNDVKEAMSEYSKVKGFSSAAIGNMQQRAYNSNPIDPDTKEFRGYRPIPIQDGIDLLSEMDAIFKNVNVDRQSLPPALQEYDNLTLLRKGHIKPGENLFNKLTLKMHTEMVMDPLKREYFLNSDMYEGTNYYGVDEEGNIDLKPIFVRLPEDSEEAEWTEVDGEGNRVGVAWNMDNPLAVRMKSYIYGAVSTQEDITYSGLPGGAGGLNADGPINTGGAYGGMTPSYLSPNTPTGENVLQSQIATTFMNPVMEMKYAAHDRYLTNLSGLGVEDGKGGYVVGDTTIPKEDMLTFIEVTEHYKMTTGRLDMPSPQYYRSKGITDIADINDERVIAYQKNPAKWDEVLKDHDVYLQYLSQANMADGYSQELLAALNEEDVTKALDKYFTQANLKKLETSYAGGMFVLGQLTGQDTQLYTDVITNNSGKTPAVLIPYEYNIYSNKAALAEFLSNPTRFQEKATKSLSDPKYKAVYGAYSAYLKQTAEHAPKIANALAETYVAKTGLKLEDLDMINTTGRVFSLKGLSNNPAKPNSPAQNSALILGNTLVTAITSGGAEMIRWGKTGKTGGEVTGEKLNIDPATFDLEKAQIGFTVSPTGFNAVLVYGGSSYILKSEGQSPEIAGAIEQFVRDVVPTIPETDTGAYQQAQLGLALMDNPIHKETFNYLTYNFEMFKEGGNISPVMKNGSVFEDALGNEMEVEFYKTAENNYGARIKYYSRFGGDPIIVPGANINELYRNLLAEPVVQESMKKSRMTSGR